MCNTQWSSILWRATTLRNTRNVLHLMQVCSKLTGHSAITVWGSVSLHVILLVSTPTCDVIMSLLFLPLITHSSGNSSLVRRTTQIMMRWYALPTLGTRLLRSSVTRPWLSGSRMCWRILLVRITMTRRGLFQVGTVGFLWCTEGMGIHHQRSIPGRMER